MLAGFGDNDDTGLLHGSFGELGLGANLVIGAPVVPFWLIDVFRVVLTELTIDLVLVLRERHAEMATRRSGGRVSCFLGLRPLFWGDNNCFC